MLRARRRAQALRPVGLALAASAGVAVIYALFVGTHIGRVVDDFLVDNLDEPGWEPAADAIIAFVNITVPLVGAVIVAAALRSGGSAMALRVLLLIGGASLTAQGLKEVLGAIDPLGGEARRDLGSGFYPSGHAALIASLCLAAIFATPTRRGRHVAAGAAAVLGAALLVGGSHHPSDLVGGVLVAAGWAAVCWPRGRGAVPETRHGRAPTHLIIGRDRAPG